jgi:mannose/cellobiose epimerase-like protein (N-acyl-D-glucosamine 2-epimerase family)
MVTGDETYLEQARHALDFLYNHGWDDAHGGWYFTADQQGNLTPVYGGWDPNTFKWSFTQHYALLGIGALCEAARDAEACAWLSKGRTFLDTQMWDNTPGKLGYFEETNLDLSNPRMKSFTATVDALTTHGIALELLEPNAAHHQRMIELADMTSDRLAASMSLPSVKFGFPEFFNNDWSISWSRTDGYVGHVLKSAWVLARVYLLNPDNRYRTAARELIHEVVNNGGWNAINGVPYTTTDWSTGSVNQSETEYWEIEQAVTGGLSNWYIADNVEDRALYLKMADQSLEFFANYVLDHADGGSYMRNSPGGAVSNAAKGDAFKAEYHSAETFYFAYLYGNLMLHRRPVTLYYQIPVTSSARTIKLNPVAIDDASLTIKSVTLDDTPFSAFSSRERTVTLNAGEGGKLKVTFAPGS